MSSYNIFQPWKSLDPWQHEYIYGTDPNKDCFLLCGRQVGKTTAMSIKAVELCVKHFQKGEDVLIASITEKQGYLMLAKALSYANAVYPKLLITKGKDKPTKHRITFTTGASIYCYAAGETGEGLRGHTIKKFLVDEGSRLSEEFFIATTPMLSIIKGSMDIASTPCGKEGFFYECSKDDNYKKFYVSAEDCPRHTKEFLERERNRMPALAYAQEYLAMFLDDLKRVFSDELLKKVCILKRREKILYGKYYLGSDIAGMGKDETTIEIIEALNDRYEQVENEIMNRKYTHEIVERIKQYCQMYNIKSIGIDDGGIGFGVFSGLLNDSVTKRKTFALNNASRETSKDGNKKKILKEEMYINLLNLMEKGKILLLNDDELIMSLKSIQFDTKNEDDKKGRIFGNYSHITEGLIRAAWLAEKNKNLNIYVY